MISKIIVFLSIFYRSLGKFLANPTLNSRGRAENSEARNFPRNIGFSEIFFFLDFCLEKIISDRGDDNARSYGTSHDIVKFRTKQGKSFEMPSLLSKLKIKFRFSILVIRSVFPNKWR